METLLKHGAVAWNPIGAARTRFQEGNLTVGSVLFPFLGVVNSHLWAAYHFRFGVGRSVIRQGLLGDYSAGVVGDGFCGGSYR